MISNPKDLLGQILSGYRLEHILGSGATGAVFFGQRVDQQAPPVAIKVLIPPWQTADADREAFQARFRREAQALLDLNHPNIPRLLGFGAETDYDYLILQYIDNGSLYNRLAQAQGPLPFDEIARYTQQLSSALDFAHSRNLVHRDIKPANVLLDRQGNAYLSDFSIVRLFATDRQKGLTSTGQSIGTPEYMSPEQMRGQETGPASDIYSLGLLVYQMVTGKVPFEGASVVDLALKHVQEQPPYPRALRPDLPMPAEAAIIRALAKSPSQRFQSAAEFSVAFTEGLQDRSYTNPNPALPMMTVNTSSQYVPQTSVTPTPFPAAPPPTTTTPPMMSGPATFPPQGYAPVGYGAPPPGKNRSATPYLMTIIVLLLIAILVGGTLGFLKLNAHNSQGQGNSTATTATGNAATPNADATATAAASSIGATATATANQNSYTAVTPGPSCDTGGGAWTIKTATVTCNGAQTTFAPLYNVSFGYMYFQWPGHSFPSNYSVSAQFDLSKSALYGYNVCGGIETHIVGSASYIAEMCENGYWYILESGKTLASGNETIAQNALYDLAVTVTGSSMQFTVNNVPVYTGKNSDISGTDEVGLVVYQQPNGNFVEYTASVTGFTYQANP